MHQSVKTICIPRIKQDTSKRFIKNTLEKCRFGDIQSIIERPLRNDKEFKKVIIRLVVNQMSNNGAYLLNNAVNGIPIKIVYNRFDYWRVVSVDL